MVVPEEICVFKKGSSFYIFLGCYYISLAGEEIKSLTDMACSLNHVFSVSGSNETILSCGRKRSLSFSPSVRGIQFSDTGKKEFMGKSLEMLDQKGFKNWNARASGVSPVQV